MINKKRTKNILFEELKAGLQDAIAHSQGKLTLRTECIEVPELPAHQKQVKEQLFHLSVKAIIKNINGDVLILRRPDYQHWDLPGGRINVDEHPRDTLLREVFEETGLRNLEQIKAHDIELQTAVLSQKLIEQKIKLLIWYHTCFSATTEVTLSSEHVEYAWVPWHIARTKIDALAQSARINEIVTAFVLPDYAYKHARNELVHG